MAATRLRANPTTRVRGARGQQLRHGIRDARRQRDQAERLGWPDVARLYADLAAALEQLLAEGSPEPGGGLNPARRPVTGLTPRDTGCAVRSSGTPGGAR